MNIIIVGCGKVGASLAERLSAEGHDLVMVDISAKKVEELSNKYNCKNSIIECVEPFINKTDIIKEIKV